MYTYVRVCIHIINTSDNHLTGKSLSKCWGQICKEVTLTGCCLSHDVPNVAY